MATYAAEDGNDAEARRYLLAARDIDSTGELSDRTVALLLIGLIDEPGLSPETRQGINNWIGRLMTRS